VPRKERNSLKNEYPIQFIHLQFTIYEQKIPNTQEQFIHPNLHFLSFSINFHSTLTKAKNFYPRKKIVFSIRLRENKIYALIRNFHFTKSKQSTAIHRTLVPDVCLSGYLRKWKINKKCTPYVKLSGTW
jgi:hypothetical protein